MPTDYKNNYNPFNADKGCVQPGNFFDSKIEAACCTLGEPVGKQPPSTTITLDLCIAGTRSAITLTREELGALFHIANEDWGMMVHHCGDLRDPYKKDFSALEAK